MILIELDGLSMYYNFTLLCRTVLDKAIANVH